jgi:prepilin-type processing-associated H-X9-DG protein
MREAYRVDWIPRNNPPHTGLSTVLPLFICPADARLAYPARDPFEQLAAFTSFVGVSGSFTAQENGVLGTRPGIHLVEISDGTSQTLMVAERPPTGDFSCGWWYATHPSIGGAYEAQLPAESALNDAEPSCGGHAIITPTGLEIKYVFSAGSLGNTCDKYHYWSLHSMGANFLFADGSVHFLRYSARSILPALATRAGNEVVAAPD